MSGAGRSNSSITTGCSGARSHWTPNAGKTPSLTGVTGVVRFNTDREHLKNPEPTPPIAPGFI
eukprot:7014910-Pyramimonas_sp.AAC.1